MTSQDVLLLIVKLALVIIQAAVLVLGLGFPEGHAITAVAAARRRPLLVGLLITVLAQGCIAVFESQRDVAQAEEQQKVIKAAQRPIYSLKDGWAIIRFRVPDDPRVKTQFGG